jgi:hypothetical protein
VGVPGNAEGRRLGVEKILAIVQVENGIVALHIGFVSGRLVDD